MVCVFNIKNALLVKYFSLISILYTHTQFRSNFYINIGLNIFIVL